ncbi:hypothetical protein CYMTET_43440 [Cymbomonas tetramitiformis]|uniref:Secreted protein n=1 Tax=Cymbomonas tetramitiformis TaxID=36881 RepID=A0AAE0C431_9CHLO|nr:hypothetical protein CYMTET_43440 [Cymbomonas tetramitiformis]
MLLCVTAVGALRVSGGSQPGGAYPPAGFHTEWGMPLDGADPGAARGWWLCLDTSSRGMPCGGWGWWCGRTVVWLTTQLSIEAAQRELVAGDATVPEDEDEDANVDV